MMRLNHVESFYAFLLRFRSEGREEEGWLATASSYAGSATHGQVDCKGQPAAAKAPCKGGTGHGQSPLQGQPPACVPARGHGWRLR
ncbi:hypothetical protein B296_00055571, partial [Ensete ventricosum]